MSHMSGPAVGSRCATCLHPDSALINSAIAGGQSLRSIGLRFGLKKDTLGRHVAKRHPGVVLPKSMQVHRTHPSHPDQQSELQSLLVARRQLTEEMERSPRSDIARELRQTSQRIAELRGDDRPKSVGVADVEGLPEQVAAWFRALEPFPDAREAMLAATDPALLRAAGEPAAEPAREGEPA